MARATADIGSTKHPPSWFYNYLLKIKMNTVHNGALAGYFSSESGLSDTTDEEAKMENKLVPVVYLHGLAGSRTT